MGFCAGLQLCYCIVCVFLGVSCVLVAVRNDAVCFSLTHALQSLKLLNVEIITEISLHALSSASTWRCYIRSAIINTLILDSVSC